MLPHAGQCHWGVGDGIFFVTVFLAKILPLELSSSNRLWHTSVWSTNAWTSPCPCSTMSLQWLRRFRMKLVSELSFFLHRHPCPYADKLYISWASAGAGAWHMGTSGWHQVFCSLALSFIPWMVPYWTKSLNGDQPTAVILLPLSLPVLGLQAHVLFIWMLRI